MYRFVDVDGGLRRRSSQDLGDSGPHRPVPPVAVAAFRERTVKAREAEARGPVLRFKHAVQGVLRRIGYQLVRMPPPDSRYQRASFDASRDLPAGAEAELRADHPRLLELRERYARADVPMAVRTFWEPGYLERELNLRAFRGDNPYVWQFRKVGAEAYRKYYLYLRDVAARDTQGLLGKLSEDGLFGCWTFEYPGWPPVSRDLLDSINELYFLDRQLGLLQRADGPSTVLDIGAGYGRLAYRALAAVPALHYLCTDAVPESTFLCEYYLRFRGCLDRAEVIPLDEIGVRLPSRRIDLAVNVHSFSEMSQRTIAGWLALLERLQVPWLFIVPNDAGRLLSMEEDGERQPFDALLAAHGYELAVREPVFADPTLREFMNVNDRFFLFRRRGAAG